MSVAGELGKDSSVSPGCPSKARDGFLTSVTASPWACGTEARVGPAEAVSYIKLANISL